MNPGSARKSIQDWDCGLGTMLIASMIITFGVGFSAISLDRHFRNARVEPSNHVQFKTVISDASKGVEQFDGHLEIVADQPSLPNWISVSQRSNLTEQTPQIPTEPTLQSLDESDLLYEFSLKNAEADQRQASDIIPLDREIVSATWPAMIDNSDTVSTAPELAEIPTPELDVSPPAPSLGFPEGENIDLQTSLQKSNVTSEQVRISDSAIWRIQLFSVTKHADAEQTWIDSQKKHQDLLGNLALRIQVANLAKGTFYRVQAEPLATKSAAADLCKSLKSRNLDCLVVAP